MRKISLVCVLLAGVGVGMMVQAKVLAQNGAESNTIVSSLTKALEISTVALKRTTAERDRLLEHLADVESGSCVTIFIGTSPVEKDAQ